MNNRIKLFWIIVLAAMLTVGMLVSCGDSAGDGGPTGSIGGGPTGGSGNGGGGGGTGSLTITDLGAYNGKYAFATLTPMVDKNSFDMFACEEVLDGGYLWYAAGVLISDGKVTLTVWRRDKTNAAWINYTESHDTMTILVICNSPTPPYSAVEGTERIFYPLKFNKGSVTVSYLAGKTEL